MVKISAWHFLIVCASGKTAGYEDGCESHSSEFNAGCIETEDLGHTDHGGDSVITEIEILNHIHENADMGKDSLDCILSMSCSQGFTKEVEKQRAQYENALKKSEEMLKERHVLQGKEAPAVSKFWGNMIAKVKNMADPSTSKLAEMVFQGSNMGIAQLSKQLNDYSGEDADVKGFAEKQLKQEEKNAETMKKYL